MDNLSLFDSRALVFKASSWDGKTIYCTPSTLEAIDKVTVLARRTDYITISCHLNIWNHPSNAQAQFSPTSDDSSTLNYPLAVFPTSPSKIQHRLPETPQTDLGLITPVFSPKVFERPSPVESNSFESADGQVFQVNANSRFYVIKSYSAEDVEASVKHGIWTSTELGNRRLAKGYLKSASTFLFFLVNGSGLFCGVAKMAGSIDFTKTSNIWVEHSRWKGIFPVQWLIYKRVPNKRFWSLKVPDNENKPVTSSRDTQELPYDVGVSMLKITSEYQSY